MFTFTWHLLLEIFQKFYESIFVEIWKSLQCKDQYLLYTRDALVNFLFFHCEGSIKHLNVNRPAPDYLLCFAR